MVFEKLTLTKRLNRATILEVKKGGSHFVKEVCQFELNSFDSF
jgi:hypothetical protein